MREFQTCPKGRGVGSFDCFSALIARVSRGRQGDTTEKYEPIEVDSRTDRCVDFVMSNHFDTIVIGAGQEVLLSFLLTIL
jgi:hypothetical protein